jgi:hypothetical protein
LSAFTDPTLNTSCEQLLSSLDEDKNVPSKEIPELKTFLEKLSFQSCQSGNRCEGQWWNRRLHRGKQQDSSAVHSGVAWTPNAHALFIYNGITNIDSLIF